MTYPEFDCICHCMLGFGAIWCSNATPSRGDMYCSNMFAQKKSHEGWDIPLSPTEFHNYTKV